MDPKWRRRNHEEGVCDCLIPVIRFLGVATAVVLCGVGVDVTVHGHNGGIFIIVASALVFFLETTWAVSLFLRVCLRDEYGRGFHCWERIAWMGGWKLSPPYVALGVALIVWPQGLWLSHVAGILVLVLAVFHLFQICRSSPHGNQDTLLPQHSTENESFDKYDDITEVLDDTLPGPVQTLPEEDPSADM